MAIACLPLALLAAVQLGLALRSDALEVWPSLRPLLVHACKVYGCTVRWPAHAELLTIVGSELESIPGTLARLGTRTPGPGGQCDLHQATFDVDERAIGVGVRLMAATALAALRAGEVAASARLPDVVGA